MEADSLRLYYAMTFELAGMYKKVSQEHIMPGLQMLSQLNIMDHSKSNVGIKTRMISDYTNKTQGAISEIARKVCAH
jgi:hypothetical protein